MRERRIQLRMKARQDETKKDERKTGRDGNTGWVGAGMRPEY